LIAIAREIARTGSIGLPWSKAQVLVADARPSAANLQVLEWLVRADLMIEDVAQYAEQLDAESVVRPAFERLGDFLIALELLQGLDGQSLKAAFHASGSLAQITRNEDSVLESNGVVSALSILVPEQFAGMELPNLFEDTERRNAILRVSVGAMPWRDPSSFSELSARLLEEALHAHGMSFDAMDSALSVCWRESSIDGFWLDEFLSRRSMANRDSFWCGYLHQQFDDSGPVRRLIDSAFELPLGVLEPSVGQRWVVMLLWFTAAADRRVKDRATRAAVRILRTRPEMCGEVLTRFLTCNDDSVRERVVLAIYGALILTRESDSIARVCRILCNHLESNSDGFGNALIRDHVRCISELAIHLNALPPGCAAKVFSRRCKSNWPLQLPSDGQLAQWEALPKLRQSCLDDDFFTYSLSCLGPYEESFSRVAMGRWILRQVATGFRYEGSGCERYDKYMLAKHGSGRGRIRWAERIGKKYQWIAMFQLASRLSDHLKAKRDGWAPRPRRKPLILLAERQLDPTLPANICGRELDSDAWWINSKVDLCAYAGQSDDEWVKETRDLPELEDLLGPIQQADERWYLLESGPSWSDRFDDEVGDSYRHLGIDFDGFLVKRRYAQDAFDRLAGRNLCGSGIPGGATWLYGFVGEYPWGTPFNIEPEDYHRSGGRYDGILGRLIPVSNDIAAEWEYDASVPRNLYIKVPARAFFAPGDLWWDGTDGYRAHRGKTVFRDPSMCIPGPRSLIASAEDLLQRLDQSGHELIFTYVGEKRRINGFAGTRGAYRNFSQVARLKANGELAVSKRVFFDDLC
jgi:hypothetical protein